MNFVVKMINGDKHILTEIEYKALMTQGDVCCSRNGHYVNRKSVSNSFPESDEPASLEHAKQKFGVLHDGTRVLKQFGEWVDADGPVDEQGRHLVHLDPRYYPEVSRDSVPTPEEFDREYKQLSSEERLAKMLDSRSVQQLTGGSGFQPIGLIRGEVTGK